MQIVPDRFSIAVDVYIIDPAKLNITYGQTTKQETLAKTGLTENRLISCEYTLSVGNEAACGVLADVIP